MQERKADCGAMLTLLHDRPDPAIVVLFKQAFAHHPASYLPDELTAAFLQAFAQTSTFLVARDGRTGAALGFAVGGNAAQLDRTRAQFIRAHGWRIAGSFLRKRLLRRMLRGRLGRSAALRIADGASQQLRFIAVESSARGRGVGTALLRAFEATLPRGSAYHAWTLEGPGGAEAFYLTHGFCRDCAVNGHVRLSKRL